MQRKWILAAWIAASAACTSWAAAGHYPITAVQVSAAIALAGEQVTPEQVMLLTGVVAATPAPQLHVQTVERTGGEQLMVRMECGTSEQCLPFIVNVHVSAESASRLAAMYPSGAEVGRAAPMPAPAQLVIRNGEQAVLHLD